jgi:putative Holliday junction resolvase
VIGRTAAVDYGRARVGLAVCDPLGIAVRGLPTLHLAGATPEGAVQRVAGALRAEGPVRVVVGLPLHEDGSESERSREARAFGAALGAALGVPVSFHDEGLTTWAAEEEAKARGKPLREARREGEVDRSAAVLLLRSWLAESAGGGAPASR